MVLMGKVLLAGGPSKVMSPAGKGMVGWFVGVGGRGVVAFPVAVSVGVGGLVGVAGGVGEGGMETAVSSPPHK